jgi:PEP-CTERM motif
MKKGNMMAMVSIAAVLFIAGMAQATTVGPITFAPGDYDNTSNTVTAGPVTHNNQTTGLFRDAIWWSINNGKPRVDSPDFINQGNSLILVNNHAVPGTGSYTAMNFTGPSISGGQSYLSIYDTTPADGSATKNVFDAQIGIVVSADVLFVKHNVSGGVVAFYNEGQNGLALLANNRDGSNTDFAKLNLVWQSTGSGQVLQSINLPNSAFVPDNWYRITMALMVSGDTWTMNGTFQKHLVGSNPTSGLGSVITSLSYTGFLSNPGNALDLTNPGEVGIMAMGNESISLPDNVGVSVTNFQVIPEPATIALLGLGVPGLLNRRKE